jgi:hypothetical protein
VLAAPAAQNDAVVFDEVVREEENEVQAGAS